MNADQLTRWTTTANLWPAALTGGALLLALAAACYLIARRAGGSVLTAGIGALICTAYSADTSWRFARDHLGMHDTGERLVMFGAGEGALLACAVMARANKKATATDGSAGTPGVPGVLVWCITTVQLVPAFAESGFWAGLVRAVIGPVMAGLLWHLAMGLEIRIGRPDALSTGLPAQIGHELRERLLSYLGLATRDRSAEEISRDRAHRRAVRLGARRHLGPWGRARLAAAVTRSRATVDDTRRHALLQDLAGRRSTEQLRTMPLASPWTLEPAFDRAATTALAITQPQPRPDAEPQPGEGHALVLDLAPMLPVQPEVLEGHSPVPASGQPAPKAAAAKPAPRRKPADRPTVEQLRSPDADAQLLERAHVLNAESLATDGTRASLRLLQRELGIGQRRAQRIQAQLPNTLAAADAQPPAKEA